MNKEEVLYLFDKYKDRPIEIDTGDSAAVLRGNIDGHWLFLKGDTVVEVKKNTPDGSFNVANNDFPSMKVPCAMEPLWYLYRRRPSFSISSNVNVFIFKNISQKLYLILLI